MKVVFVNRSLAIYRGGAETWDLEIAKQLVRRSIEVEFMVGLPLFGGPRHDISGFKVTYVRSPYLRGVSLRLPHGGGYVRFADMKMFTDRCVSELRKSKPDLVQCAYLPTLIALKRHIDVPCVIKLHGPPLDLYRGMIARFDAALADGGDCVPVLRERFRPDIVVAANAVDTAAFRPDPEARARGRCQLGLGENDFVVLFVGRFAPDKNVNVLLEAFRRLLESAHRSVLVFAGEGELRAAVVAQSKALGVDGRVRFLGHVDHQNLPGVYAMGDLFVLPSRYDNYPLVAIEAMSCGLPVVATKVGGIPDIVHEPENGILVLPDDAEALCCGMRQLMLAPARCAALSQRNRQAALERFSWDHSAGVVAGVYASVLGRRKSKLGEA